MSVTITCNYCGETIEDDQPYMMFVADAERSDRSWVSGTIGHYHTPGRDKSLAHPSGRRGSADAPDCWAAIYDVLQLAHDYAPTLEGIPVASGQAIAALRRRHSQGANVDRDDEIADVADLPVQVLDLRPQTRLALSRAGVDTLRELHRRVRDRSILSAPGVAQKTLAEIERALDRAISDEVS
jgi:hypothetical protein